MSQFPRRKGVVIRRVPAKGGCRVRYVYLFCLESVKSSPLMIGSDGCRRGVLQHSRTYGSLPRARSVVHNGRYEPRYTVVE